MTPNLFSLDPEGDHGFDTLELISRGAEGTLLVDRECRIVWMCERYRRLLELPDSLEIRGLEVESLIPHSLMRQVVTSGQPQLLDLMRFRERWFVVTRLPLMDQQGEVIGALGMVFFDELAHLRPLVDKYSRLSPPPQPGPSAEKSRQARYSFADLIGTSPAMLALRQQALRVAPLDSTVLLLGETGTGKEVVAQALHHASPRAQQPFVSVNTAALPETLVEAELFGAMPGAYTGADPKGRKGKFELAQGGTLFLDEIGEMSATVQSKLLRALQEREIEPVGGNRVIPIDVRVIAATSRDLEQRVAEGAFRADLYYRLNVLPLQLPPLRDRYEDLPQLIEGLSCQLAEHLGVPNLILSPELLMRLTRYHWPGNIRELRNVVERCLLFADNGALDPALLDSFLPGSPTVDTLPNATTQPSSVDIAPTLAEQLAQTEKNALLQALSACGNNRQQAAIQLGISRATLYQKLNRHGI